MHFIVQNVLVLMTSSDGVAGSTKKKSKYFSPRQLADLFVRLLPKLKSPMLNEHESLIRSIIIQNDIDSFKLGFLTMKNVYEFIEDRVNLPQLRNPFWKFTQILQQVVSKSGGSFMNWENIVNAVAHEMGSVVARDISSVIAELEDITGYTANGLINELRDKMKKKLTISEATYLRGLFERKCILNVVPSLVHKMR